jgi:site-specific recombinase XerD
MAKSHEECCTLLDAINHPIYAACAKLIYACGLRNEEARLLTVEDIDSQAMLLRKIGKRNFERVVPINNSILQLLRQTWKIHRNPQYIFPQPNGNPITGNGLDKVFRVTRMQCGLGDKFTPHVLRHSFATRLLEQGVPIETIQLLLGHSSRRSTQIYLHLTKPIQDDVRGQISTFVNDLFSKGGAQ